MTASMFCVPFLSASRGKGVGDRSGKGEPANEGSGLLEFFLLISLVFNDRYYPRFYAACLYRYVSHREYIVCSCCILKEHLRSSRKYKRSVSTHDIKDLMNTYS